MLSAGCCQSQPTATTPAKSNQAKYRKNSHTLSRQCLDRRIADAEILKREVATWKAGRNDAKTHVRWRFTTQDARVKLHRLYPSIKP